nr:hypothetical protein [Tanacetum cinerariifolium]
MANRENTITGKYWGRKTLRLGLDEFHDGKVTVPIHWNYWKTMNQEIASDFVNCSWNAENPSGRQEPSSNQAKNGRKSQGGNKPRIPGINSEERFHSLRGRPQQVV